MAKASPLQPSPLFDMQVDLFCEHRCGVHDSVCHRCLDCPPTLPLRRAVGLGHHGSAFPPCAAESCVWDAQLDDPASLVWSPSAGLLPLPVVCCPIAFLQILIADEIFNNLTRTLPYARFDFQRRGFFLRLVSVSALIGDLYGPFLRCAFQLTGDCLCNPAAKTLLWLIAVMGCYKMVSAFSGTSLSSPYITHLDFTQDIFA